MGGADLSGASVHLRAASEADIDRLLPLVRAYRVFYGREPEPDIEEAYLRSHLADGTSTIFVAETGGEIVGFVQLFKTYNTVRLQPAFVLEDLFVAASARSRGVASSLLNRCVEYAKNAGATVMFLETAHDNYAAQRVYEANGWTKETHFVKYNAPLE